MHELSICRAITKLVECHADGSTVRIVRLRVGELRQIVPDTLAYCWGLVTEGSDLESAALEIERVPAAIRCAGCRHVHTLTEPILVCPECQGRDVEIVSGEEFLITSLDLMEV
ncbi:hydrogenase maturation nickel metallochaperone HypA [Pseudonocardia sp. N23]|uniref:hydrogenase maturation nickel metallochaperone HypA n=1 Tax=Pseudonocardia sp. N23 TaxID=1987376 RepID=UPI000BFB85DB|nr:hydrogenase maturation nickel metallochaperone HypA [Pseudonocardia sp. N23]GAY09688.1 hydrogenase nickel incorporation protein HypA [Pseudonocardia sp. N23]